MARSQLASSNIDKLIDRGVVPSFIHQKTINAQQTFCCHQLVKVQELGSR